MWRKAKEFSKLNEMSIDIKHDPESDEEHSFFEGIGK